MSNFRTLLAASILVALPTAGTYAQSESFYSKTTWAQVDEASLELALTGNRSEKGDLEKSENLIPEGTAKIKLGLLNNAFKLSVKAIQEDDLDTLGDTDFDDEWRDEVIKELNVMFRLGDRIDVVVGDHAAIGASNVAKSNDIRRRDSITSQTEQSYESVSGIQIVMNGAVQLPESDRKVIQKVNEILSNVSISIFNGDSRDELLNFDDLNSMALNSETEIAGIGIKMSYVNAETQSGDEIVYILGAEKDLSGISSGMKAYAEYQNFEDSDDAVRTQDSKMLIGISKDFSDTDFAKNNLPQKVVASMLTNTVLSGEYARVERSGLLGEDSNVLAANATRRFGKVSMGLQVSHDDEDDDTALKLRVSRKFK